MAFLFHFLVQLISLPLRILPYLYAKLRSLKKLDYLVIEISGNLSEAPPLGGILQYLRPRQLRFYEIVLYLYKIWQYLSTKEGRKHLGGILFVVKSPQIGWGRAYELRQILAKFNELLPCWAYLEKGDKISYYIASACDKVVMSPATHLECFPVTVEQLYLKTFLEKIGVKAQFLQIGRYKAAAEIFERDGPSSYNEAQWREIVGEIQIHFENALKQRNPSLEKSFFKKTSLLTSQKALELKLVDAALYEKELPEILFPHSKRLISLREALSLIEKKQRKLFLWYRPKKVALVVAEGPILESQESHPFAISLQDYQGLFKELSAMNLDALIFRCHSPGGSALASDILWQSLYSLKEDGFSAQDPYQRLPTQLGGPKSTPKKERKEKALYVSLSDVAASGGYYISAFGGKIYASPLSLIGSIGVIAGKFNLAPMAKKLGVARHEIPHEREGGFYSFLRDFSLEQKKSLREHMEFLYELFLDRVSRGRGLAIEKVRHLAEGRLFSGSAGKKHELVDETKGLFDILHDIKKELNIKAGEQVHLEILPKLRPQLDMRSLFPLPWGNTLQIITYMRQTLFWYLNIDLL
ncbi:MAG: S49 family peptidase [Leptospiraceae bacterium]|nr:S49 family peptidase [Leptospiraceae bacterium]